MRIVFFCAALLFQAVNFLYAQDREFVAMEYKDGISNQIFLIHVTDSTIVGIRVNGYITISPGFGTVISKDKRKYPKAYIDQSLLEQYPDDFYTNKNFLRIDSENFLIYKKDVSKFYFNPQKKWGMGPYPHNGRIMIFSKPSTYNHKKKRDLILVGIQDEKPILEWLK